MTNTLSDTDAITRSLKALVQDSAYLEEPVQLYEAVLPLLCNVDVRVGPVSLSAEQARSKMEMGLPLLHDLDLELDGKALCDLFLRLACAVEKFGEGRQKGRGAASRKGAVRRVREALEEDKLNVVALLQCVAAGEKNSAISSAESLGLDADIVWMLAQNALKPVVREWRAQLAPLSRGIPWHKGYCFICGADAALGELQGNAQAKHLRCGQCGADWPFRRLQCVHCGNEDHTTLGYFCSENEEDKFRVEVCEKCKGYLKVVSAFTPAQPEMLQVEDLATLHLDYIAEKKGYTRQVVPRRSAPEGR
jgi:FdhE protein